MGSQIRSRRFSEGCALFKGVKDENGAGGGGGGANAFKPEFNLIQRAVTTTSDLQTEATNQRRNVGRQNIRHCWSEENQGFKLSFRGRAHRHERLKPALKCISFAPKSCLSSSPQKQIQGCDPRSLDLLALPPNADKNSCSTQGSRAQRRRRFLLFCYTWFSFSVYKVDEKEPRGGALDWRSKYFSWVPALNLLFVVKPQMWFESSPLCLLSLLS